MLPSFKMFDFMKRLRRYDVSLLLLFVVLAYSRFFYAKVVLAKIFQRGRLLGFYYWLHFVKMRCQTRYTSMLVRHHSVPCFSILEVLFSYVISEDFIEEYVT